MITFVTIFDKILQELNLKLKYLATLALFPVLICIILSDINFNSYENLLLIKLFIVGCYCPFTIIFATISINFLRGINYLTLIKFVNILDNSKPVINKDDLSNYSKEIFHFPDLIYFDEEKVLSINMKNIKSESKISRKLIEKITFQRIEKIKNYYYKKKIFLKESKIFEQKDIYKTPFKSLSPISDEVLNSLFQHFKSYKFFDTTVIKPVHANTCNDTIFEFNNFKNFINDIRINGKTDFYLYFSTDQRTVGYFIFDVFRVILKRHATNFSNYVYYYQNKNGFVPIKLTSISSESKRNKLPPTEKFLEDFFQKFRSSL